MRIRRIQLLGLAVLALAIGVLAGRVAVASASVQLLPAPVTLDGVGGVTPGMSVAEVERRWGVRLNVGGGGTSECQTAAVRAGGMRGDALFENGRLGAVWFNRGARTPAGIETGSTLNELIKAYGSRLQAVNGAYTPGTYSFFLRRKASPHWEIRFDLAMNGRVSSIGFGNHAVHYVEGCS